METIAKKRVLGVRDLLISHCILCKIPTKLEAKVQHFGKCALMLSHLELDERIDTTPHVCTVNIKLLSRRFAYEGLVP